MAGLMDLFRREFNQVSTDTHTLKVNVAKRLIDFERIRRIRNASRNFMTNDTSYISFFGQVLFWIKNKLDPYTVLYIGKNEHNKAIAYGVIHYDKNLLPWVTGAIDPCFRGCGYGRLLFSKLCDGFQGPIYLEVLENNNRARSLYKNMGFVQIDKRLRGFDGVLIMRRGPQ
jgi:GNAT superfamily N-acetyltransferase